MSDEVWMGYLLHHEASFTVVQSPFVLDGQRVFGADSDATTLAVAALLHRLEHDHVSAISVPEGIDASSLSAATGVPLHNADAEEEALGGVDERRSHRCGFSTRCHRGDSGV